MKGVSIILPAFNEQEAIGEVIDQINNVMGKTPYQYEIIVVDDGSGDNTSSIAQEKGARLIQHQYNKGVGAARKTGIRHAKWDIVVMSDADGTYPVSEIPNMLQYMDEYDMVIGARKKEAGKMPILRSLAKESIRRLACFLTKTRIPDLNSGLRVFKKDLAMDYHYLLPNGHSWVSTITLAFLTDEHLVKFIPIDYFPRKGKSTFHPIRDTYDYILTVVRTVTYFEPLRFFTPISLFLIVVGLIFLIHGLLIRNVNDMAVLTVLVGLIVFLIGLISDQNSRIRRELQSIKRHDNK